MSEKKGSVRKEVGEGRDEDVQQRRRGDGSGVWRRRGREEKGQDWEGARQGGKEDKMKTQASESILKTKA